MPGSRRPSRSAASIIETPMRSFTEPAGLNDSIFTRSVAGRSPGKPRKLHQRGVAERVGQIFIDSCHGMVVNPRDGSSVSLGFRRTNRFPGTEGSARAGKRYQQPCAGARSPLAWRALCWVSA